MPIERLASVDLPMIRLRSDATRVNAFELVSENESEPFQRIVSRNSGNYKEKDLNGLIQEFQSENMLDRWRVDTKEGARRFALLHQILDRTDNAPIILSRVAYAYNTLVHDFLRWIDSIFPYEISWTNQKHRPHLNDKMTTVSYFIYRCNPEILGEDEFLGLGQYFCLTRGWRNNYIYLETLYEFTDVIGIEADEETQQQLILADIIKSKKRF